MRPIFANIYSSTAVAACSRDALSFQPMAHVFFSELSDKQEIFKPKRDPSKKIHIHRAGQRPAGINDDEKVEPPPSKLKKERARAKAREGTYSDCGSVRMCHEGCHITLE